MSQWDELLGVRCFANTAPASVYPILGKGNSDSGAKIDQTFEELCPVCGDKVSGYHYGLLTCESCKGFFKRTVQNKKIYSCVENKRCQIDKSQRKRCPFCRYQKCLKVGMRLDAVRSDRMRGGRNKFGPMYKQDRARKQQMQAFHRASGFLRVIDPAGALHTALEKSLFSSVRDWIQEEKTEINANGPHILLGKTNADSTKLWPYTGPQIIFSNTTPPVQSLTTRFSSHEIYAQSYHSGTVDSSSHFYTAERRWLESHHKKDPAIRELPTSTLCDNSNATDAEKQEAYQSIASSVCRINGLQHEPYRCFQELGANYHEKGPEFKESNSSMTVASACGLISPHNSHSYSVMDCQGQFAGDRTCNNFDISKQSMQNTRKEYHECQRRCNFTLELLLSSEIEEDEVRSRTLANLKSIPDQGFTFVCDVVNQALFLLVEWAKSSPYFKELKTSEQMLLLQNGWMDILVLSHAFRQMDYGESAILLPTGHSIPNNFFETYAEDIFIPKLESSTVKEVLHKFSDLAAKFRNLHLDRVEFVCLKFIILFNTNTSSESKYQLRKTQECINAALWEHSMKRDLPNRERVSQIFCTLCDIRSISMLCEEYLLYQYHKGRTPINNLLMEMFHAKRNVTS